MKKRFIIILILLTISIISFFLINTTIQTNNDSISSEESNISEPSNYNYQLFTMRNISTESMHKINNIYYKKVNTYEDYIYYKNKYASILEMTPFDFDNNFMIITAVENTSMQYLIPEKIYKDNNMLYIGLCKNIEKNNGFNAISIIISNELDAENIDIYKDIQDTISYTNYLDIKLLPKEYTAENATHDLCYVVKPNNEIYNQETLSKFLNCVNRKENAFIRMTKFISENETYIADIYYDSQKDKFLVCQDWTRSERNFTYNYYEYSKLEQKTVNLGTNYTFYVLTDLYEEDFALYTN